MVELLRNKKPAHIELIKIYHTQKRQKEKNLDMDEQTEWMEKKEFLSTAY